MRDRPPIAISTEARPRALASIKRYFLEELGDDIGDLKAELMLDFILREIGPTIYNQAIADARAFFEDRSADLEGVCYHAEFPYWPVSERLDH